MHKDFCCVRTLKEHHGGPRPLCRMIGPHNSKGSGPVFSVSWLFDPSGAEKMLRILGPEQMFGSGKMFAAASRPRACFGNRKFAQDRGFGAFFRPRKGRNAS